MFDFLKEYDQQSLTRLITVVLLIFFMAVTVYLIYARFNWMNYDIFCLVTVGGGAGTQLVNKWVNSKYNTNMAKKLTKKINYKTYKTYKNTDGIG